jgi:thioredoxin reductase
MSRDNNDLVDPDVDVLVIGGGAAGLTAAVTLGRARRNTVVIDSGAPRNAPSPGVHMFLTRDGISPADLTGIGRQEVESYGGRFIDGTAVTASRSGENFAVTIDDGRAITARRLMVTTGLTDELPDIPGVRELWGRDVHHCPYCHGWELDGRAVGVIGSGPRAVHQALMFRQWVSDLVLFLHSAPDLTAEEEEQLAARGIRVVIGQIDSLEIVDGHLAGVRMADGDVVARQSVVVAPRMVARSGVLTSLGLQSVPHPMGLGEFIESDAFGLTAVAGVWVAGNVADLSAGVIGAAAAGMVAATAVNADLIAEDTRRAVAVYRKSTHEVPVDAL